MEGKRSNPTESDVNCGILSKRIKTDAYSLEQESDSSYERQTSETVESQTKDRNKQICDPCFLGQFLKVMAFYMCYVCGKCFCKECFSGHDNSHGFISLQSESEQLEREIDEYLSYLKNESDAERKANIMKNNVCVCDYMDTKHEFDKEKNYYRITGITGYGYKWWVVCDYYNYCIKVFSLGSNMLQRYIRLGCRPQDVTEIIVENKTTEHDSASSSEAAISETDNKPNRKHLLAVTLPWERLIMILDLGESPAVIHDTIEMKKYCRSIDCYDSKIYIVCEERSLVSRWSLSIMTVEGVMLKTFQPDVPSFWFHHFTVLNENIYMTDHRNDRVVCYNDEGRVLHEIKIDGSLPECICVDRSEDKIYICAHLHNKVYELESDLSRYKSVIDRTTRYMEDPQAMCFYSDKLYVGHRSRSYVTVVRLL